MAAIAVFGGGGRAVTAEARRRGHGVTAVVREPARYPELGADGVAVVRGDVTDAGSVAAVAVGHVAAVHAVSPFSGPERGFDSLDPEFFVKAADALLSGLAAAGVGRLVAVGLFADLLGADGRPVMDDPAVFPPDIRPFALAHTAGLRRLRESEEGGVDRVVLTPGGGLEENAPRTGHHAFGGEEAPDGMRVLSYAGLAGAVVDEIARPTVQSAAGVGARRKVAEKERKDEEDRQERQDWERQKDGAVVHGPPPGMNSTCLA
ncbi:NAD(P)H-binding protein [Streptomyces sp. S.PB5]|uniref:NAD(P)-dependent oxidoreductase n=1 Tax=Streptomyces sp. S.PB5 TaxID=3020844 RepID=UPI0025AF3979|nr:NAD(P)H-binding protein [Streptomyces sp. S.PB5]MDN3021002.1 NAD(P)H-binding protein [Streptomyces sp. S.PB5]